MDYSYLEAKRNLDDRSMNRQVWSAFSERAARLAGSREQLRIVEIGAGSGSMVERLASWGLLPALSAECALVYETVEPQEAHIPVLEDRLQERRELSGFSTFHGTVGEYLRQRGEGTAEILIAHAVLDLFSADEAAQLARSVLAPGGLLYASITFDGESYFEPVDDPQIDELLRKAYHDSMARDGVLGGGFGRKLLTSLPRRGVEILEAGSSDWILMPRKGEYYPREAEFLKAILSMVDSAVEGAVGEKERSSWLQRRLEQLESGELIYIAHQLDILAERVINDER
jgi:hypothetical protein